MKALMVMLIMAAAVCAQDQPKVSIETKQLKCVMTQQQGVWVTHAWGMPGQDGPILLSIEPNEEKANKECMKYQKRAKAEWRKTTTKPN